MQYLSFPFYHCFADVQLAIVIGGTVGGGIVLIVFILSIIAVCVTILWKFKSKKSSDYPLHDRGDTLEQSGISAEV